MSRFSKLAKKIVGGKVYQVVSRPIKKIAQKQAIKIKAPTSDPAAFSVSVMKIPIY